MEQACFMCGVLMMVTKQEEYHVEMCSRCFRRENFYDEDN